MPEPLHILHVVGGMNRAGTETWLMHILRRIDRTRFQFDFLMHSSAPGDYDQEIRSLGGRILNCPGVSRPWKYATGFLRAVRATGPYDVVHSHVHFYSGYVLWLAALAGIPKRVAHSHNTGEDRGDTPPRRLYRRVMQSMIRRYATMGLGASREACATMFGSDWEADPRYQVLHCGIDLQPFAQAHRAAVVRQSLGIPKDALVVGHVGRFVPQKNHTFLLEVAAQILERRVDAWFLLVGDGPLRLNMEQKARDLGIAHRVIFTGARADVPTLMAGMDAFLFPSLYEGLGIALVEAQAAGVPCMIPDILTKEVDIVPAAVHRLPLVAGASEWAERLLAHAAGQRVCKQAALKKVVESDFNLQNTMAKVLAVYLR